VPEGFDFLLGQLHSVPIVAQYSPALWQPNCPFGQYLELEEAKRRDGSNQRRRCQIRCMTAGVNLRGVEVAAKDGNHVRMRVQHPT
jgi:hypothetical protein